VTSDSGHPSVTQRVGPLSELPALLREFGVDPAEVFAASGVDPDHVTPDTRVAFTDLLPLLQRAAIAADCPHLGLVLGLRFEMVKHHGLIGQLMDTAPTVRQALVDCATWQLGYSSGAIVYLNPLGGEYAFGYGTYSASAPGTRVLYDIIVGIAVRMLHELTDGTAVPMEVHFCHRAPDDPHPYQQLLKLPLRFNQHHNGIIIDAAVMAKRRPADPNLRRTILDELQRRIWARPPSVADRVGHALRHALHLGDLNMASIARDLGVHPRTLRRRLRVEGRTFEAVRDEVRFAVAREFLELTDIPVGEIGALLAFATPGVFSEAFRRWSGATPTGWRGQRRLRKP
jgi:AraC-like DNA-binding protein